MKITGYKKADTELEGCMVLSDIGIAASASTLRDLAAFLTYAAKQMEELGEDFDHVHFMYEWAWQEGLQIFKFSVKNIFNQAAPQRSSLRCFTSAQVLVAMEIHA